MNAQALSQARIPLFRHRRLGWFLLISLLGHLLLLWFWLSLPAQETVLVEPAGSLQLRLQAGTPNTSGDISPAEQALAAATPATTTSKNITPAQPSPRSTTAKSGASTEIRVAAVAVPPKVQFVASRPEQQPDKPAQGISPSTAHAPEEMSVSQQTASDPVAEEAQHLLGQLRHELARHFHYPAQAVRRGWQGTVQLSFEVDNGGRINKIYVARSSGHALLDRAAVSAMGKVGQISFAGEHHHRLRFPVVYRLEEG